MEEGRRVVLLFAQFTCQARHVVERSRREEQRLHVVGQRREDRRHALDALSSVGIGILERECLVCDERIEERGESLIRAAAQRSVVEAEVLFAEALQDEHHHVHRAELCRVGGLVNGRIQRQSLPVAHVMRRGEGTLRQRAEDGKGSVEYDARLDGAVDVLIGIADGDGTHGMGETAAHATDGEGNGCRKGKNQGGVVEKGGPATLPHLPGPGTECPPQCGHKHDEEHDQIPMTEHLTPEYLRQIACAFVTEFGKHAGRSALASIGEIYAVGQVRSDGHSIDDDKHPAHQTVICGALLPMAGQEHEEHDQYVCVQYGGRVESQSRKEQAQRMSKGETAGIKVPIGEQKGQSAKGISHVYQQQVYDEAHYRKVGESMFFHLSYH